MAGKEEMAAMDRDMLAEGLLSEEPYTLVEDLSEMGSRAGGTQGERQAIEYLLKKMSEYGFENVHKEEFSYGGWLRGTASLQTTHPVERAFDVISFARAGSCDLEGELHYVGLGTPADWESQKDEIKGKIVIVDAKSPLWVPYGIHRREKFGWAIVCGATGFIWMRDQGGFLAETGGTTPQSELEAAGLGSEIPAIAISREEGMALIRLAKKSPDRKVRLRISVQNTQMPMQSANVIGEIPGSTMKDREIVIGAHFDGHDIATGSMDDASGAAVVMGAGRLIARHKGKLARTVRLICFPLEETGCIGSRRYVATHKHELGKIDFMLNLDGAGRGGLEKGFMLQAWPELLPIFKKASRQIKWPVVADVKLGMHSDMYPFSYLGVPSGTLASVGEARTGRNFGHTIADTIDKVSSLGLRMDSTLVARVMAQVADTECWPAKHKTTEEIMRIIKDTGQWDAMRLTVKDYRDLN